MSTPIENEIRKFKENDLMVYKIWSNGAWHELNITPDATGTSGMKEYTKGKYIFQVPAGVTQLTVSGTAAGAGGRSGLKGANQYAGFGGGAGEWVKNYIVNVIPGEFLPVEVGEGGEGGYFSWTPGGVGGNTLIGDHLVLHGGRAGHSGGTYNAGTVDFGADGSKGTDSVVVNNINTGAAGGTAAQCLNDEGKVIGGAGGDDAAAVTTGGSAGTVTSTYGAGGAGGAAGYGGNGGNGGSCDGAQATESDSHHSGYDAQDAQGYGAGGGSGATHGRSNYAWGRGGKGGDGYLKIEWS